MAQFSAERAYDAAVTFTFRPADDADLDRLVDIHTVAYPSPRTVEDRLRNFRANVFGDLRDLVVAREDGDIVGHARLFAMRAWFGGREVPVGGIASVAVAPEARGRGVATALLRHLHKLSDARGDAITMLYAFRQAFYARLGYGPSAVRKRLAFDPAAVPPAWRAAARSTVSRARPEDRPRIERAYLRTAARSSGWLTRREVFWDRLFARERRQWLVARRGQKLVGYVAFEVHHDESHAETRLVVDELVWDDDEARRALVGGVGAMRDQVHEVVMAVADDDPLPFALEDADRRRFGTEAVEHALGDVVGGPMVRIADLGRALAARGYAADGRATLMLEDTCERLLVTDGRARVKPVTNVRADVIFSRPGAAAVLYGGMRLESAVALGLANGAPRAIGRAAAMLALPPMSAIDDF